MVDLIIEATALILTSTRILAALALVVVVPLVIYRVKQ